MLRWYGFVELRLRCEYLTLKPDFACQQIALALAGLGCDLIDIGRVWSR